MNFGFSEVTPQKTTAMALTAFCTNLRAAHLPPALETEPTIPEYDTVSTAVWKSPRLCGMDTARVKVRGSLFNEEIA